MREWLCENKYKNYNIIIKKMMCINNNDNFTDFRLKIDRFWMFSDRLQGLLESYELGQFDWGWDVW